MFSDAAFQLAAQKFVPVLQPYDGLNGAVVRWTLEHGNTNHDPSVLAWVLDPKGEVVEAAPAGVLYSASAFNGWLDKMCAASFPLVDPTKFPDLAKEAKQVASRTGLGTVLASLRKLAADEALAAPKREQATALIAAIEVHAKYKQDRAKSLETQDPPAALEAHRELAAVFKGDAIGAEALATHDRLKKDKAFAEAVKAHALLSQAKALEAEMKPAKAGAAKDFADQAFKAKNAEALAQAKQLLDLVVKRHPTTPAATEAGALLDRWKLR